MILEFDKFQGAGNDFIIIDGRDFPLENPNDLAKVICTRHFSVGADDLLYLENSKIADIKMRICEPDGSEASMCGNGVRCVASYIRKKENKNPVYVETLAGIKEISFKNEKYIVDFGSMQRVGSFVKPESNEEMLKIKLHDRVFYVVSAGEPHAVTLVKNIEEIHIENSIEVAREWNIFPYGINVDFVEIKGKYIKVRTFERGVWGETLACGTGAVSSAFIAREFLHKDIIPVKMKGGNLDVIFKKDKIFLSGDAEFVYKAYFNWGGEK